MWYAGRFGLVSIRRVIDRLFLVVSPPQLPERKKAHFASLRLRALSWPVLRLSDWGFERALRRNQYKSTHADPERTNVRQTSCDKD